MRINHNTEERNTETRKELAGRYFVEMASVYEQNNMAIISLLSDVQEQLKHIPSKAVAEHYRVILNDIKCVLIEDCCQPINK